MFLKRVAETAGNMNKVFIDELKRTKLSNDNLSLNELENIDNGFFEWAYEYKLFDE
ncbi:MAG: hypothetical protein U5K00_06835 [Melioribacteraceae bacterium]|nr:hypothetical protein [Melioribacteraceae bacterium]